MSTMQSSVRRGQLGTWWVVNAAPRSPAPLYWEGRTWHDGRPMLSFDHTKAAQFDSAEQAETNVRFLGLNGISYRIEQHAWCEYGG